MSYPTINANRILYNLDGTRVGYNTASSLSSGVTNWLAQTEANNLQTEGGSGFVSTTATWAYRCFYFFFPESKDITHINISIAQSGATSPSFNTSILEYSNDTTNGTDGTWTSIAIPSGLPTRRDSDSGYWRVPKVITQCSCKALRMYVYFKYTTLYNIHLYGNKTTDTDDIVFLQSDGTTQYTALQDFGDTPEGSIENVDMYIKNTSTTLTANSIAVATGGVNASNITVSLDGTTYSSSVTVTSLAPGATQIIKVRNTVGAKPQTLIPRSAYLTATVSTWT